MLPAMRRTRDATHPDAPPGGGTLEVEPWRWGPEVEPWRWDLGGGTLAEEYAVTRTRASGGIGRRAGFRFLCPKGCGGSSPPSPTPRWARAHFADRASPPRGHIHGQPDAPTVRRLSSGSTRRGLPGAGSGPARVESRAARRVTPVQRPTFSRVGKVDCTRGRAADGAGRDRPRGARPPSGGSGPPRRLRRAVGRRHRAGLPRANPGR